MLQTTSEYVSHSHYICQYLNERRSNRLRKSSVFLPATRHTATFFFPCADSETQTDQTFPAIWNVRKDSVECIEFKVIARSEVFLIEQTLRDIQKLRPVVRSSSGRMRLSFLLNAPAYIIDACFMGDFPPSVLAVFVHPPGQNAHPGVPFFAVEHANFTVANSGKNCFNCFVASSTFSGFIRLGKHQTSYCFIYYHA